MEPSQPIPSPTASDVPRPNLTEDLASLLVVVALVGVAIREYWRSPDASLREHVATDVPWLAELLSHLQPVAVSILSGELPAIALGCAALYKVIEGYQHADAYASSPQPCFERNASLIDLNCVKRIVNRIQLKVRDP